MKIYCPRCEYRPKASDRWVCLPGCGCTWNTFDTRGVCPDCIKVWEMTSCPACHGWSRHEAWYHEDSPPAEAIEELVTAEPAVGR